MSINIPRTSKWLLSPEAVKLGRFVVNTEEPSEEFFDPPLPYPPATTNTTQIDLTELQGDGSNAELSTSFDPFVGGSFGKHIQDRGSIATAKSSVYKMENSRTWFRKSIEEATTREWFEKTIAAGEDIFLIVGYQVVYDAKLRGGISSLSAKAFHLQAPVNSILAGAGILLNFGLIPEPKVSRASDNTQLSQASYTATGEQIGAVQYRRVKFKWYSSHNLDKAALEKGSRWKLQWEFRGQESGQNDIIEPLLSDDNED